MQKAPTQRSDQEKHWFLRIQQTRRGPYTSAKVRRLLHDGELRLTDEISPDAKHWQAVREVSEVVPLNLRAEMGDRSALSLLHARRSSDPRGPGRERESFPYVASIVILLLILLSVGAALWLDQPGQADRPDCRAPAGPGVDWRNCNLSGLDVGSASLAGANLNSTLLSQANLTATDLSDADLRYADLHEANLSYARLRGANLQGADLRKAELLQADLAGADLRYADLSGSRLDGANLQSARLGSAIWRDGRVCGEASVGGCLP